MSPLGPLTSVGTPYLLAVAFALGAGLAGPAAWQIGRMPLRAELAAAHEAWAKERLRGAELNAQRLQTAIDRGDGLTQSLLASQARMDQLNRSRRNALPTATTGGPCLGGPALRLLDGATGLRVSGLPKAASGAAAADGAVATDTDITGWALDAGAQYATCSARLDALIDWFGEPQQPTALKAPAP